MYINATRFPAIVTIKIESTGDPTAALQVGGQETYSKVAATPGFIDVYVDAGKELLEINETVATVVGVRSAT